MDKDDSLAFLENGFDRIMEKENVLIVHNYYQIPGGEDMVVANEKELLEANGHRVTLYRRSNSEIKRFSALHKFLLPFITIFNIKTYRDIKRIIKEDKIDIVHVHNTLALISPSVYYAALNKKIPVVQTIHNFRLLCPGAIFYRDKHICEDCVKYGLGCAVKHRCYKDSRIQTLVCVINLLIHRATGIYKKINYICLTEFNKQKFMKLKQIRACQVFVKPNFVDRLDGIIHPEKRQNQFVFAGRLDRLKGIDILFEAWRLMGDRAPELLVYGVGPLEKWCRQFIAKHKLGSIKMKGFLPNTEVRKIMAVSKAVILPTRWYEGFPMSILEAYSVGTPALVPDLGNVGSIVIEGICGSKFMPDNPGDLIRAIQHFSSYENIIVSTYTEYKTKYTKETNYEYLINIYKNTK